MGQGLKLLGGGANSQRLVPYLMRGLLLAIAAVTLLVIGGGSLSAQTTGSITGTVLLDDGTTAVNGAVVFVNEYRTGAAAGTAVTGADGTYTVSGLEGGRYFVFVNAVRQGYPVQFYDGASDVRSATTVLVAAGDTTAGINFALDSGGSISGTVLKASDGTAVSGAEVWAELAGGGGDGVRTASDGTYTITGLAAGQYRVEASAISQGLVREYYNETADRTNTDAVTVSSSADATGINFTLAAGSTISGTVTKADGTAVENADVRAELYDSGGGGAVTTTADDGTYSISGLDADDYRVSASADDQSLVAEFYNDTTDREQASRVTVTATSGTSNVDFALDTAGGISGTVVTDGDSTPIANADVQAERFSCCGPGGSAITASDGSYSITGLAPASYRVHVEVPQEDLAGEFYNDTTDWSEADEVAVTAGQTTTGVDFSLATGGTISGSVTKSDGTSPAGDVFVHASEYDTGEYIAGANVAADGTYAIEGLPSGDYRVGTWSAAELGFAQKFYNNRTDWDDADRVTVAAGVETADIDFTLDDGGSITGVVQTESGTPVEDAEVWAETYDCCGGGNGARTASDGTYTITGLGTGDYRVQVHAPDQGLVTEFYNNTSSWEDADRVPVTAGATTADIDFSVGAGGSISGTVLTDSDGEPVANAEVWAETYDCCGGGNGARTAKDGTYTLNGLASGDYRVQVFVPEEGLAGEFYDDTGDWSKAARVEVSSGATTQNIDFSLGTGGSISGTVYQENGTTPLANTDVWANTYECCGGGNGTQTDSDGTYTIDGLASGDYRVEAFAGGQGYAHEFFDETTDWNEASRVEVTGGDTTSGIDFTLDAGGTISGTVYEADGVTAVADADVWADSYECCGGGNGARTATDGTYTISGLAAGEYRVQTHAREGGLVGEFYDDTTDWGLADSVTVTPGQDTSGIDFSLASGGSISGTVVRDSDGSGVADVDVWANSYDCCGGSGTRTDEDGSYTITGLASGEFRVEVYAAGHGLAGEFYDDEGNWDDADSVTVTVGQTTTGINFSLASGGTISATVYAADGTTPVSGANLWANGYDDEGGHGWTNSESDGTYTISGLSEGEYRVEVEADDLVHKIYDDTTQWHLATPVSVSEGQDTSGIDFTLETGGIISGTVYEGNGTTPVPGVHVSASSYDGDGGWGWAETAQDGTYVMNGLATGDYLVQVDAGHKGYARQYFNVTTDRQLATRVSVTSGSTTPNVNFSLSAGGSISGTVVRDSDSSPVDDADVWADSYECCGEGNGTRTASDGTFTISGLGAGDYRVQVRAEDEDLAGEFYNDTSEWSDAERVTVVADQTTSNIDFSLATGGSITGTVVSAAGDTPIADADVWAETYDCCAGGNWARTDKDGTYTISGLAEGDYRVQVDARGEGVIREYYDDTQDWGQADPVTVVAGQATSGIDFSLDAGGSISGTVYEADGATPVADADVWADTYDCCGGGAWARTESDGTYELSGLAADDYRVQVQVPEEGLVGEFYDNVTSWDEADRVSVVAGETTPDIDFSLGSGGSIFGTVYESDGTTPVSGADVSAEGQTGGWGHSRSAADGTYTIQGLPSGDYVVRAEALDQSLANEFYDGESDWGLATLVSVTVGEVVPLIDFQLNTGGSISGTVYESYGTTPIEHAHIWANRTIGGGGWAETSSDGTYTILGLAAGDYRVEASAREQGFAGEFYDNETNWDSATLVAVTSGSEAPGIDFTLDAGGTISGTVYLADGVTAVSHADVWADTYECCAGGNGTRTDKEGTYTIEGLGAGDYRVQARAPEQGLVGKFYEDTADWSLATAVTVASGQDTPDIDFTLGAGGSITGTVYEADGTTPVSGADVWANTYECCAGGNGARTAADGTYEISGLASGEYRVEVSAHDQGLVREYYDDTTDWSGADRVTVVSGQATADIDFTLSGGGAVSGVVTSAADGTAIAGADVWANTYECCGSGGYARTASDGSYLVQGLPDGEYRVEVGATSQGFAREYYDDTSDYQLATPVGVSTGQTIEGIDVALDAGATISGTVVKDSDGTPAANVDVWADAYECCGSGNGTRTGSDGTYTLEGLAPGDYRVKAEGQDEGLVGEYYDNTTNWDQADRVAVAAGQDTPNIDFSLGSGGSISGTVYEEDGVTAVADADVRADPYECCGGGYGDRTASDGTYTIEGLAPGEYRVEASATDQGLVRLYYDNETDYQLAATVVVTAEADTANVDFALPSGSSISGTVYLDDGVTPVANVNVHADTYECCGGGNGTRTDDDGRYTISGLAEGDYRVRADGQDQGLVSKYYDDTTDWSLADRVAVAAGQDTTGIDFRLGAGGSIAGTVTDDSGDPISGADVWAGSYECCGGGGYDRTASDGSYLIQGLGPGEYRVEASAGELGFAREYYDDTNDYQLATSVEVSTGGEVTAINFTLSAGGSISGVVTRDSDGTAVANADVWADAYDCCGGGNGTRTQEDGSYTITGLAEGEYRVRAQGSDTTLVSEYYDNTTNWDEATSVTAVSGQDTPGIDFSLGGGGSISGTVTTSAGSPVGGARVQADTFDCCGGNEATTASDGTYEITGLAPGDYRVEVRAEDQGFPREYYNDTSNWDAATPVAVASGADTPDIDFVLDEGGSISGTVLRDSDGTPVGGMDVRADSYECCDGGNDTRTEDDGTYLITGLAAGEYRVEVRAAQGLASEFYEDTTNWNQAATVVVAAGETTPNIDFSLSAGASISGTVYESDGVTVIADADVWAGSYDCCGGGYARTASDGTYVMDGLAPGDYRVESSATDQGFAREYYQEIGDYQDANRVTVVSGADTPDIDFTLDLGGTISGRVYEPDGTTAVPDAQVWAQGVNGGGGGATTEDDGTYVMEGLTAGDYHIGVFAEGFAVEFYDGTKDFGQATLVVVVGGEDTPGIDFVLDVGAGISGTVYDSSGSNPLPDVDVWASGEGGFGEARTDADGRYTIAGLASGSYKVEAEAEGYAREYYNETANHEDATLVDVIEGQDTSGIDFTLAAGGSISGHVYEADGVTTIAGAEVFARSEESGAGDGTSTESDGSYVIEGLPVGSYVVDAQADGFIPELYSDAQDEESATLVTVSGGSTASGIDFTLEPGGSISGTVYESDGTTPIEGAEVFAELEGAHEFDFDAVTGSEGGYVIDGLPAGSYLVEAEAPGFAFEIYSETQVEDAATLVAVTVGQDTQGIDFTLDLGGSISGTVYEAGGTTPIGGAEVFAEREGLREFGAETGENGGYVIDGLPAGSYLVEAEADGFAFEIYSETQDDEAATLVAVTVGQETQGIDFTLDLGGSISGTVYESGGTTPIEGAVVVADSEGLGDFDAVTGPEGGYVIDGLPAGSYLVDAAALGFAFEIYSETQDEDAATLVAVTVGQDTQGIDFTLEPGGSIAGTVYESGGTTPIEDAFVIVQGFDEPWPLLDEGFFEETDSDGTYVIYGLPAGEYRVFAVAGDQGFAIELYEDSTDPATATSVAVTAGSVAEGVDFTLELGGSISGTVFALDGQTSLEDIVVVAEDRDTGVILGGVLSEDDGSYVISGLPARLYYVYASDESGEYQREFYLNSPSAETAQSVQVTASEDSPDINFTLEPTE